MTVQHSTNWVNVSKNTWRIRTCVHRWRNFIWKNSWKTFRSGWTAAVMPHGNFCSNSVIQKHPTKTCLIFLWCIRTFLLSHPDKAKMLGLVRIAIAQLKYNWFIFLLFCIDSTLRMKIFFYSDLKIQSTQFYCAVKWFFVTFGRPQMADLWILPICVSDGSGILLLRGEQPVAVRYFAFANIMIKNKRYSVPIAIGKQDGEKNAGAFFEPARPKLKHYGYK